MLKRIKLFFLFLKVKYTKRQVALIFVFCLFSFLIGNNQAFASVSGVVGGVSDFVGFFSDTVVGKLRSDFCGSYYYSLANGIWKEGEFRVNLGSKICTEKVAIKTDIYDKKKNVQSNPAVNINISNKTSETKTPSVTKVQEVKKKVETSGLLINKKSTVSSQINKTQIVSLTNVERSKAGLISLSSNSKLDTIAEARVQDMFVKEYFEHISPSGDSASLVAERKGYRYITIGENIALGNFDNTQALVNAWMNSEGHRKNILNTSYTEIGVYAREGQYKGQKVWISAQIFGRPLNSCAEPDKNKKGEIESLKLSIDSMKNKADADGLELKSLNKTENPNLFNLKVSEYNLLVNKINSLIKEMGILIQNYNIIVRNFNECIKLP
jgi:uncharacterized protein YkwD